MKNKKNILLLFYLFLGGFAFAQSNQNCEQATILSLDAPCITQNNLDSLDNTTIGCIDNTFGALWYSYQADFNGYIAIETQAKFNDVVSVFTGTCGNLTATNCTNRDEYGFDGEALHLAVNTGTNYYIQISGAAGLFGLTYDSLCIAIKQVNDLPMPPSNDICDAAQTLILNQNCLTQSNQYASMDNMLPNSNERAKASIWYQFVATETHLQLETQADFSPTIAVYEGNCNNLNEIKSVNAHRIALTDLILNATYWVQVSGNFASIEGNVCVTLEDIPAPDNQFCNVATMVTLGGACIPFDNYEAGMSEVRSSCEIFAAADVWFRFVAPSSGIVKFRTEADFLHAVAIYEGTCDNTDLVYCAQNPNSCLGYVEVPNLTSGQTYYVQIMSVGTSFGHIEGSGCLEILDSQQGDSFTPLSLSAEVFCQSAEVAELRLEVAGGTGNYTFLGNTDGEQLAENENYIVRVEDSKGCVQVRQGTVNCSTPTDCEMFYHVQKQGVTCPMEADGIATISTAGDTAPTFLWPSGETSATEDHLAAGNHRVSVTSSLGCTFEVLVEIAAPPPLVVETTIIAANEEGSMDGSITLLPSGGTPPYTFQWANGSIEATLSNLAPDDYYYTVIDANNCAYTALAEVIVDPSCPDNRTLMLPESANALETFAAVDWIVSSAAISNQANVVYKAGNRIELKHGFSVLNGADFKGLLEDCSVPPLALPDEEEVYEEEANNEASKLLVSPNPFSNTTTLSFYLKREREISLRLYSPLGYVMKDILDHEKLEAGDHQIAITSESLDSGVYFIEIEGIGISEVKPLVLVK